MEGRVSVDEDGSYKEAIRKGFKKASSSTLLIKVSDADADGPLYVGTGPSGDRVAGGNRKLTSVRCC